MMHYDEFVERRNIELTFKYEHTNIKDYLVFDDFCAQEYETYVLAYVKAYHDNKHKVLPRCFAEGLKSPTLYLDVRESEIPY